MSQVRVRYFAQVRSLVGHDHDDLELPASCDVAQVHDALGTRHPQLRTLLGHTRLAHNHTFVNGALELADGDELAVIPPVSGG